MTRPAKGGWAPGYYFCRCHRCKEQFQGAKQASTCELCAYDRPLTPLEVAKNDHFRAFVELPSSRTIPLGILMSRYDEHCQTHPVPTVESIA